MALILILTLLIDDDPPTRHRYQAFRDARDVPLAIAQWYRYSGA